MISFLFRNNQICFLAANNYLLYPSETGNFQQIFT